MNRGDGLPGREGVERPRGRHALLRELRDEGVHGEGPERLLRAPLPEVHGPVLDWQPTLFNANSAESPKQSKFQVSTTRSRLYQNEIKQRKARISHVTTFFKLTNVF